MKTVMIFDSIYEQLSFIVFDGDLSHLNNVYLNGDHPNEIQAELDSFLFDEEGNFKVERTKSFPYEEVNNGAIVIVAGFV